MCSWHHPYQSFASVVEFLEHAASDPAVLAIKMTLYRTSGDSPIVHSLVRAAELGKQVTVLVELRARFDEANNILWARQLEEARRPCRVRIGGTQDPLQSAHGRPPRRRPGSIHYLHLGTGNYHPSTARFYTDLSLFTSNEELGEEVAMLLQHAHRPLRIKGIKQLLVAPFQMHDKFLKLIQHERDPAGRARRDASS